MADQKRKLSKAELKAVLLAKVNQWIDEGCSPDDAIGKLTERQYDFLIDQGVDFDALLLTPEQLQNVKEVKRVHRACSPNGYNKKYPQNKQDLFNGIVEYVKTQGAEIIPREKQNFRDLDFTIQGTAYKIVLSNPRK